MRIVLTLAFMTLASVVWWVPSVSAQPLGPFRWQLQPYCNVLTLAVVQQGGQYQLDGTDDQCGAVQAAGVRGMAFLNPNGSIGFGLTVVTAPGGTPVHIDATISLPGLNGTWRDSAGNTGNLIFGAGVPSTGSRPVPTGGIAPGTITNVHIANNTIGSAQINPTQVQTRVAGSCPAGAIAAIDASGAVSCAPPDGAGPFKRTTISGGSVGSTATTPATAAILATLTFTAPLTGTALLSGSGYCNQTSLTTGATNVVLMAALATDNTLALPHVAVNRLPQAATPFSHQFTWAVQRDIPVSAGSSYTVVIKAWHESGATSNTNCPGTFAVRIHGSTMP